MPDLEQAGCLSLLHPLPITVSEYCSEAVSETPLSAETTAPRRDGGGTTRQQDSWLHPQSEQLNLDTQWWVLYYISSLSSGDMLQQGITVVPPWNITT